MFWIHQFSLRITNRLVCKESLSITSRNYTKKGYKPSQQDCQDGTAQEKRFGMMNILLQLWPDNLTNQLKNLNNAIEANWKEVVGHPANTKLVSENKWLVWLG